MSRPVCAGSVVRLDAVFSAAWGYTERRVKSLWVIRSAMLKKILLTLLVAGAVYLVIRFRQRRARAFAEAPVYPVCSSDKRCRNAGLFLAALMLLAFVGYVSYAWWAIRPVVSVRVIDPETGKEAVYLAYEGDVDERGFKTLDGRLVRLGNLERIEIEAVDDR